MRPSRSNTPKGKRMPVSPSKNFRDGARSGGLCIEGRRRVQHHHRATVARRPCRPWVSIAGPEQSEQLAMRDSNLVSVHGDQVDISTQISYIMFQASDFLYLSDMKLVFQQRHSFITQPGTTNGTNGVKTRTFSYFVYSRERL